MKKVLIIDDRVELRLYIRLLLMDYAFEIVEAASLEEADAALETFVPDLVFVDIMLGGRADGLRYCERLSATLAGGAQIVLCTGYRELIDGHRPNHWGASAVLPKPFAPAQLISMLRSFGMLVSDTDAAAGPPRVGD